MKKVEELERPEVFSKESITLSTRQQQLLEALLEDISEENPLKSLVRAQYWVKRIWGEGYTEYVFEKLEKGAKLKLKKKSKD